MKEPTVKGTKDDEYEKLSQQATRDLRNLSIFIGSAWLLFAIAAAIWANKPSTSGEGFFSGVYGDTFGALTALFTGLALAGIWFTTRLQKIELKATREELAEQADALKAQVASLSKQSFENTFFQLLRRYTDVSESTLIGTPAQMQQFRGKEALSLIYGEFAGGYRGKVTHESSNLPKAIGDESFIIAQAIFREVLKNHRSRLPHLFRTMYHVFKFVRESSLPDEEQRRYASIARAQLSDPELLLLFYNCVTDEGAGFKPLVEHFAILKHVPVDQLGHKEHLTMPHFYTPNAFHDVGDFFRN